ncbi:M20 family metallopeptidase [Pyrinomonas methylaliphatogenes]|uniref:Acetylornithine deacetylase/succinyldiaminopimelate desuccinylase-like deacylase n=1 Tax=Pyrinomonas methylaliphatogenes TaxID=454194 RepID=A0A0B6WW49_9BACT|nr:M20 family metallopeptidase [Pyrinomonas methylaliphatogenes]CDM64972.1 acetylornithine deacetylase/succinyldiaminopimelate desuccinylase-like deacylase [Pyrinomonas methylaliphatogenes]
MEIDRATARRLNAYMEEHLDETLALARQLVETESPSKDAEGSCAVVELLVQTAQRIAGVSAIERRPAGACGEHLRIVFGDVNSGARPVVLLGHTDTVYPRGTIRLQPWREEDGRIYGPGIFDMKINCALALMAMRACAELDLPLARPVVALLTCDEESGSDHGRAIVEAEARRAAHVLVLEPSAPGGCAKTARKGTGIFCLEVEGRAAHAGLEPEKGASAVLELARQIERIYALAAPEKGTTVNVGVVCGGTQVNVVAAHARAEIDIRFSTQAEAERVERALRELKPFDARTRLRLSGGINRPPLERTPAVVALYERARRIASLLDWELCETSVGGASDGNFAAAVGATVLDGLGVAGDGAHSDHEHILVADVARRGALLAALMVAL